MCKLTSFVKASCKVESLSWKSKITIFLQLFVEKNDVQISSSAVLKKILEKMFFEKEKNPCSLFVQIRPSKRYAEIIFK